MLEKHFNPLFAVEVGASPEEVKAERDKTGKSLSEVKARFRAASLYGELSDMRYRNNKYEGKSDGEVLDALIELLMDSVSF